MTIDPRLEERRRVVAEDRARRKVGHLMRWIVVLVVVGVVAWILLSPWMSAREVRVEGVFASNADSILERLSVVEGRPLVLIRASAVETALEADPYVADATVEVRWPDRVLIEVEERAPLAWVETSGGWSHRALDGVALPSADTPDDTMAWIQLPEAPEKGVSRQMLGALEFVEALPGELRSGATIRMRANGELWGEVGGYEVRLGRAIEMRAKALSLAALLDQHPRPGSTLVMIAPAHPAVTPPGEGKP